jgi:hypothetical protein
MLRRSAVLFAVVGCLAALVVAGCGSSKSSSSSAATGGGSTATATSPATGGGTTTTKVSFAKTKFVFHAGLAFGAFHRWIYRPFRAGVFGKPLMHKAAIVKAAAAALFTYHELRLAAHDVQASKILRTLFAPLRFVINKVRALGAAIRQGGHVSGTQINGINTSISGITSSASAAGATVVDRVPTAGQLAAGVAP